MINKILNVIKFVNPSDTEPEEIPKIIEETEKITGFNSDIAIFVCGLVFYIFFAYFSIVRRDKLCAIALIPISVLFYFISASLATVLLAISMGIFVRNLLNIRWL